MLSCQYGLKLQRNVSNIPSISLLKFCVLINVTNKNKAVLKVKGGSNQVIVYLISIPNKVAVSVYTVLHMNNYKL